MGVCWHFLVRKREGGEREREGGRERERERKGEKREREDRRERGKRGGRKKYFRIKFFLQFLLVIAQQVLCLLPSLSSRFLSSFPPSFSLSSTSRCPFLSLPLFHFSRKKEKEGERGGEREGKGERKREREGGKERKGKGAKKRKK